MVAAGGVSARFGRWVAETAPGLAASRAGLALVPAAAAYLFVAARLGLKGPSQWALAMVVVALPVTRPVVRRLSELRGLSEPVSSRIVCHARQQARVGRG